MQHIGQRQWLFTICPKFPDRRAALDWIPVSRWRLWCWMEVRAPGSEMIGLLPLTLGPWVVVPPYSIGEFRFPLSIDQKHFRSASARVGRYRCYPYRKSLWKKSNSVTETDFSFQISMLCVKNSKQPYSGKHMTHQNRSKAWNWWRTGKGKHSFCFC